MTLPERMPLAVWTVSRTLLLGGRGERFERANTRRRRLRRVRSSDTSIAVEACATTVFGRRLGVVNA